MQIVFRTDASTAIGSGHVVRCATLGRALKAQGADVLFVCRNEYGNMLGWLESQGWRTLRLPADKALNQLADATTTLEGLRAADFTAPDWVVVDHYGLDQTWERAMRIDGRRMLAIDDLADRPHDTDLLLDQNLVAGYDVRYRGLVPEGAIQLLGPRYAMLQPHYADEHRRARRRSGRPSRVLVYFGASDLPNLTEQVVGAILASDETLAIDIVIGAANRRRDHLLAFAEHPSVTAHLQLPSLVDLMVQADLAFGAGGATSWERLCLGLPAVVVTLADNQRPIAEELHRRGLAIWVGDAGTLQDYALRTAINAAIRQNIEQWFDATKSRLVDGRGVDRVVAAMIGNANVGLVARPVESADEALLLDWANDPTTRQMAFQPHRIEADGHRKWLRRRLADPDNFRLFVIETAAGVEVGQVRFELDEGIWIISYSIAREFRGRGLAGQLLDTSLKALYEAIGSATVSGRVRPENIASRRVFERVGFTVVEADDNAIEFRRQL
jgi:UDP-2,4-diacetamido-2,4,6-trideoxy-beta-L-altropyranose hydrolase